jgi:hypothetical protein
MENRIITEGEGRKEEEAPLDPYTQLAEAVWQSIASILETKSKAQYVFIPAKSVIKKHIAENKPHVLNYVDRYLASKRIKGWVFAGIMYHGKKYKKVGKHYIYVREGSDEKVWREVKPWIRVSAQQLREEWGVPVYPKSTERARRRASRG